MNQAIQGNILLVEDEENLHASVKLNLELSGYTVTSAFTGPEALKAVKNEYFDLIILDIMLPELDGISVTENIRLKQNEVPILIVSAKNEGKDRVLGLRKGADDYLTKPFNLDELLLRVEKLVLKNKRLQEKEFVADVYRFDAYSIDFKAQRAIGNEGRTIELSKRETMLLKLLIEHKNEVVTRERILQMVWGYQVYPLTRTIDNHIMNFRKYFEKDTRKPKHFHSIRGMGYKFTD